MIWLSVKQRFHWICSFQPAKGLIAGVVEISCKNSLLRLQTPSTAVQLIDALIGPSQRPRGIDAFSRSMALNAKLH